MNKYKVIALDLDDTLIDNVQAMAYSFSLLLQQIGLPYDKIFIDKWIAFDFHYWEKVQNKTIAVPLQEKDPVTYLRSLRFYLFFSFLPISFSNAITYNEFYCTHLGDHIVAIEGVYETLQTLFPYYQLVIASNGVKKLARKKLETAQISSFISTILCSEEVGENKPHPLFFKQLLNLCNCNPKEMLLVGDSLTSDILGGMQNGIDTVWFNQKQAPLPSAYEPTYEINHFLTLSRILLPK